MTKWTKSARVLAGSLAWISRFPIGGAVTHEINLARSLVFRVGLDDRDSSDGALRVDRQTNTQAVHTVDPAVFVCCNAFGWRVETNSSIR